MVAPTIYRFPRASAVAAATEVFPEPPMVLTHCKAGAKSAAGAAHDNARITVAKQIFCKGLISERGIGAPELGLTRVLPISQIRTLRVVTAYDSSISRSSRFKFRIKLLSA